MGKTIEAINSESTVLPGKKVIGIDLDDTLFWREVGIRYFGHLKNLTKRPALPKQSLDEIPRYDHTPYDIPASNFAERISRVWHSRRTVIPGFAQMIRDELETGTQVYGITGRRASKAWFEMTDAQLKEADIKLTSIRMAPKGVSGLLSKADAIRELEVTDYYEDDRRSVLYLAKLFPNIRFNYIDHGLAHLSEKDIQGINNIKVIPIREFCPVSEEKSRVRNSNLRQKTDFVNASLESVYEKHGWAKKIKAWHITAAGVLFSIVAIELAEHQNRTDKYSWKTTLAALGLGLTGATLDLIDGKWARIIRDRMTDEKAKEKDEMRGQADDPFADGVIEGWQAGAAAYTAWLKGDRLGTALALGRLATTNFPRTAKAIVATFGFKVPETYSFKDLLHGDIRIFGVSLGRKIPNYGATLKDKAYGIPLQVIADAVAVSANGIVTRDRLWALFTSKGEHELSEKEEKHARFRAAVLGAQSLAFMGIAYYLGKRLLSNNHR